VLFWSLRVNHVKVFTSRRPTKKHTHRHTKARAQTHTHTARWNSDSSCAFVSYKRGDSLGRRSFWIH